jgi:hypothetical protein
MSKHFKVIFGDRSLTRRHVGQEGMRKLRHAAIANGREIPPSLLHRPSGRRVVGDGGGEPFGTNGQAANFGDAHSVQLWREEGKRFAIKLVRVHS